MCKKFRFHTQICKKSPYRGRGVFSHTLPPLGRFAPSLWPPLTNPGCTTVTAIAKMHKGPCSPLIGVKEILKRGGGGYRGFVYMPPHTNTPPPNNVINVEENAVFIHEFSKNLPTVGGGDTPSHTPPPPARSLRSLALVPLLKNPGYATVH